MKKQGKIASLVLVIALTASFLVSVECVSALSIPKATVPEFTLQYTNNHYYVPATNFTDPNTGEVTTYPAKYVDNKTIIVSIKNEKSVDTNPKYHVFYNVRFKSNLSHFWPEIYCTEQRLTSFANDVGLFISDSTPRQSSDDFTVLSFPVSYQNNSQVDFQVQALVGYDSEYFIPDHGFAPYLGGRTKAATAYLKSSSWSDTQTITVVEYIPDATPTPTAQSDTQTGGLPGLSWEQTAMALLSVTLIALTATMLFLHKRSIGAS